MILHELGKTVIKYLFSHCACLAVFEITFNLDDGRITGVT